MQGSRIRWLTHARIFFPKTATTWWLLETMRLRAVTEVINRFRGPGTRSSYTDVIGYYQKYPQPAAGENWKL